jgi:hypothetical protein
MYKITFNFVAASCVEAIFKSARLDIKQELEKCTDKEVQKGHRRP